MKGYYSEPPCILILALVFGEVTKACDDWFSLFTICGLIHVTDCAGCSLAATDGKISADISLPNPKSRIQVNLKYLSQMSSCP